MSSCRPWVTALIFSSFCPLNKDQGFWAIWPKPTTLLQCLTFLSLSTKFCYCFAICISVQCFVLRHKDLRSSRPESSEITLLLQSYNMCKNEILEEADYEKPMRTLHKHSHAQWSTGWVWHGPSCRREQEAKCSTAAFLNCLCSEKQVSLVTMSAPPLELLLHLLVYHWI
jgi:hypothetical protein